MTEKETIQSRNVSLKAMCLGFIELLINLSSCLFHCSGFEDCCWEFCALTGVSDFDFAVDNHLKESA